MLSKYRFTFLLGALFLLLLTAPAMRMLGRGTHHVLVCILMTVAFSILLLTAAFAVSNRRTTVTIGVSLAAATILLQGLNIGLELAMLTVIHHVLGILFLSYTVALTLRYLFAKTQVTLDTICASLCTYLLLGVLWAISYSLVDFLTPETAFRVSSDTQNTLGPLRFGAEDSALAIYFSFVSLTTLGYGDVVPNSAPARALVVAEAVTGQLYLAVLVARLVGLHISQANREQSS